MKSMNFLLGVSLLAAVLGCSKVETPENIPDKGEESTTEVYKVVAHRGGYLECGSPANSIASLKYAIGQRCYAAECDIVLTKDNKVVVQHPSRGCYLNGLVSFEHTLAEICSAGTLANGEKIPTLEDYLGVLTSKSLNPLGMKIYIDVKRLVKDSDGDGVYETNLDAGYAINACLKACNIIKSMDAEAYCEFLIPTGTDIFSAVRDKVINDYKISLGWATCTSPDKYGKAFANLSYTKIFGSSTTYGPMDYVNASVPLGIYGTETEAQMDLVLPYYSKMKSITTEYPRLLISKIKKGGYAK